MQKKQEKFIWINNGEIQKRIDLFKEMIPEGYKPGLLRKTVEKMKANKIKKF